MASKSLKAMAAIVLIAGSGAATAQGARSLSIADNPVAQRAGESVEGQSALAGAGTTEWILIALSLGLIIFGIVEFTSDQNNSNSP